MKDKHNLSVTQMKPFCLQVYARMQEIEADKAPARLVITSILLSTATTLLTV